MVQIALVGGAHIHTPGFIKRLNERSDVSVRYAWDHDPERAKERAVALDAQQVSDLAQIWSDDAVEAVVICAETNRHEPLVMAAAEAGKHLFVEKPLGMGAQDAYTMAEAIKKAGVLFQTGYFKRGDPVHQFLKTQLVADNFGTVTRFRHSNCHAGSLNGLFDTEWAWMADMDQSGCGAFGDLGAHSLDIMLWLMPDVMRVAACLGVATGRYGETDEYGEALIEFAGGVVGTVAASWVDVTNPISLELSGTEGHAYVLDGQLYFRSSKVVGADGLTPWTDLPEQWPHAFELFLDAITGVPDVPLVAPREAAVRSAVMEALYQSARTGRWVTPK